MASAHKLTDVITQIIEFAKMLPGFLKFPQEDQIVLLKAGTAIIHTVCPGSSDPTEKIF